MTVKIIRIEDSSLSHVRDLGQNLRLADQRESFALGYEPHKGLYQSFRLGFYRKTGFINDKIAAMWGVAGTPMGLIGAPYLLTSPVIEEISPLKFARLYKKEVEIMKRFFPLLENYVDASYTGAVRMLEIAGFKISEPIRMHNGLFYKFSLEGYN